MGKDYGEPIRYDPDFKGPVHNRSCTDIIWLILFIAFLCVWGFVGYYGIKNGNMDKVLAPIDSRGRHCGLDYGLVDKPYLVFFDITKCLSPDTPITGCSTKQVCVDKCPDTTIMFEIMLRQNPSSIDGFRNQMVCTEDINKLTMTAAQALEHIANEKCASYVLKSQSVMRRCMVNVTEAIEVAQELHQQVVGEEEAANQLNQLNKLNEISSQIVQDLVQSRWYLLGSLVVVAVICFIYILLLRWVVRPLIWTSILGLIAALIFCVYLCYKNYAYYRANPVTIVSTTNLQGYTQSMFTKPSTWMVILIIVAVITLLFVLVIIFLRNRISVAIGLIKEGSKAVTSIKSTIFFPLFPWFIQCFVIAFGVIVLLHLLSLGEPNYRVVNLRNDTSCNCQGVYTEDYVSCEPSVFAERCHDVSSGLSAQCQLATCYYTGLNTKHTVVYMHLINLLGFFWLMFFIDGVSDMMLASTFSTWYWTFRKRDLPFFTLTTGIFKTIIFHLGTVAFGALIIAIVRVIRVILEYVDRKLKKFDNPLTRCLMCCCKCFFWCLESFLKFINKNAYIMCAIHGTSFCKSARDAFSLLMRNVVRVVVLDKVVDFLFFISKLLISIAVGFAVYYMLEWNFVYEVTKGSRLHYNYVPAVLLSVATYLISTIFFNVYAMAVDTLFLCFLEDCERNDGSPEKPYFMSKGLMQILGKRNKIQ